MNLLRSIDRYVIRSYPRAIAREADYALNLGISRYERREAALKAKRNLFLDAEFVRNYCTGEERACDVIKSLDNIIVEARA